MSNHQAKSEDLTRQELAQRLVDREVLLCVSVLVSDLSVLLCNADSGALKQVSTSYEEIIDLSTNSDYLDPVRRHIEDLERTDLLELAEDQLDEIPETMSFQDIRKALITKVEAMDMDDLRSYADDLNVEPDESEVYEYWVVTGWLAAHLRDYGEKVGDICDLNVWGRTCTGQSMTLDHVIQQIAVDFYAQ